MPYLLRLVLVQTFRVVEWLQAEYRDFKNYTRYPTGRRGRERFWKRWHGLDPNTPWTAGEYDHVTGIADSLRRLQQAEVARAAKRGE